MNFMKALKFGDFIVFFLITALSIFSITKAFTKKGTLVHVSAAGNEYSFSLEKDGQYDIEGSNGPTKIEIKEGRVRIIDSACPNKTCVKQGWGSTIVCLPNDVIITVESEGGYDAIAE